MAIENITNITTLNNDLDSLGNSSILSSIISFIKQISLFVQSKVADLGYTFNDQLAILLTIFIGILLIFIGTKITNKIAKVGLWIIGGVLVFGIIASILN